MKYVANLVLDVLTEIDNANGGKNRLAQRRDEIMQNLRTCGFEKKILLERHSKLNRDKKYRALVYNCFGQKIGDALKVEIVSTVTSEVVASKWDEDLPRCAANRKSAINKTGWEGDTFVFGNPRALWLSFKYVPDSIDCNMEDPYWYLPNIIHKDTVLYFIIDYWNTDFVVFKGRMSDR